MDGTFFIALNSIDENGVLEADCAFCDMSNDGHGKGKNLSPELIWGNAPAGTKSFALLCIDIDVPTDLSNKNKPDIAIFAEQKRTHFIHWMACNIPATVSFLPKGLMNKNTVTADLGINQLSHGLTDFSKYVSEEATGYWGPCSPTNDLRLHRYIFRLYALSIEIIPLENGYSYEDFKLAIGKTKIASANVAGIFTRNKLLFD